MRQLVDSTHLTLPVDQLKTFPSWRPRRKYDHILLSDALVLKNTGVLEHSNSDHLPISVEIELPAGIYFEEATDTSLEPGIEAEHSR